MSRGLIAVLAVVAGLALATPAIAGAASWSRQRVALPRVSANAALEGISCPSATACTAVGWYTTADGQLTLAESWNGTSWTIQRTPNPSGSQYNELLGVSCASSSMCIAVGFSFSDGSALVDIWNGTSWSAQSIPLPSGNTGSSLNGISCVSATQCTAVGEFTTSIGRVLPLAEYWNGTSWTFQSTVTLAAGASAKFQAVSCSSATACTAVGSYLTGGTTLAEIWNGSSWKLQSTPPGNELTAISCVSANACTAVGDASSTSGQVTLAEQWDGTGWTTQTTPNPSQAYGSGLTGISCSAANACIAVGYYSTTQLNSFTLVEVWNGTNWMIQSSPTPGEAAGFRSISCSSASACIGGGDYVSAIGATFTLAEGWHGGSWTVQRTRQPFTASIRIGLSGVSCTSATACTGVGYYDNSGGSALTLAEYWNGISWKIQPTPNPSGSTGSSLSSVSCSSATACTAVGTYTNSANAVLTLAEVWNGTSWTIESTPNPSGSTFTDLTGVSCRSASSCIATGSYNAPSGSRAPFSEVWGGANWRIEIPPDPSSTGTSSLNGVSCVSAAACTAVGVGADEPLAEVWSGTSWAIQPVAKPAGQGGSFNGVSCTGTTACTAVGVYNAGNSTYLTLAEAWDGTSWTIQSTRSPSPTQDSRLTGVSCVSASSCTAIGKYANSSFNYVLLAEAWDGTSWTVQSTPTPTDAHSIALSPAISCTAGIVCTAVGTFYDAFGTPRPFAERYS